MIDVVEKIRLNYRPLRKPSGRLGEVVQGKELYIYGAGSGFYTFYQFVLKKYDLTPAVVMDGKFSGESEINGFRALHPDSIQLTPSDSENAVAIITVGKKEFHEEILNKLESLGFRNIVFCFDIFEYHLAHCPNWFVGVEDGYWNGQADLIAEAYSYMEDAESRQVFEQFLSTFIFKEVHDIVSHPVEEQYFAQDLPIDYSRMINCGSYDGDTIKALRQRKGKVDALACFEPDQENFRLLSAYLSSANPAVSVCAFPCGVYKETGQLRFSGQNQTNSAIDEEGEEVIQCVALDDALPGFRPTFINMDVEGAEPDALLGARRLIETYQPDLAICVYHAPFHLWQIASILKQWHPEYKLHLRNYTSYPAETVLYAVKG